MSPTSRIVARHKACLDFKDDLVEPLDQETLKFWLAQYAVLCDNVTKLRNAMPHATDVDLIQLESDYIDAQNQVSHSAKTICNALRAKLKV